MSGAETQSSDWFHSIARTLKWNERQRQKSFVVIEEENTSNPGKIAPSNKSQADEGPHVATNKAELLNDQDDGQFDIDDVSEASTPASPTTKSSKGKSRNGKSHSATSDSTSSLRDVVDRFAHPSPRPRPPPLSHRHTAASRMEHPEEPVAHEGEMGERDYQYEPHKKRSNTSLRFERKPISPTKQQEALDSDKIARRPSQGPRMAFAVFGDDQSGSESEVSESPE